MKQIYSRKILFILLCSLTLYLPDTLNAQCTCSGGLPATPITYTITKPLTMSSVLTYSFPQFNPSIGTLSCVSLKDTIDGISTTGAINTDTTKANAYLFQLTLSTKVSGPGIVINHVVNKLYGYDTLTKYPSLKDTITYGPDTVFNHIAGAGSSGGNAAYLGAGTVDFTQQINGGMIAIDGGTNYRSSIKTIIGGKMKLTYYWCPAAALANGIGQFTIMKFGNTAMLQWVGENEQNNNFYDVEYSKDGIHFTSLTSVKAYTSETSSSSSYQFQFNADRTTGQRVYFRIKKSDPSGKSSYSAIKPLEFGAAGQGGMDFRPYPNPVSSKVNLTSRGMVSGKMRVSIINTLGQVVYNQGFQLNGSNSISFDLPSSLTKGVYYLQVRNLTSNTQQLTKLFIQAP